MPPEILVELKLLRLAIEDLVKLLSKDYEVTLREARSTEEYTLTVERKRGSGQRSGQKYTYI